MLSEGKDLRTFLGRRDSALVWVDEPAQCDIAIVHKNTDALSSEMIGEIVKRGGLYIAYTTREGHTWQVESTGRFFGTCSELKRRLAIARVPIQVDTLLSLLFPFRYEYFIELSLRLLSLTQHNVDEIEKVILHKSDETSRFERNCNLREDERRVFESLKEAIHQFIHDFRGRDACNGGPQYQEFYERVYSFLLELAKPDRENLLLRLNPPQ
jgi:hypothetical protein